MVSRRNDKVSSNVGGVQKLLEQQSKDMAYMARDFAVIKTAQSQKPSMSQGSSIHGSLPSVFPNVTSGGFSRALEPTILFCNTAGGARASRANFHSSVVALAAEAVLEESCFNVVGEVT